MAEVLVTGAKGLLGSALLARLGDRAAGLDLPELDITRRESVDAAVRRFQPRVIVNAAALTDVDHCQRHPEEAFRVHGNGVRLLAETGIRIITLSTDHVFTRWDRPMDEGVPPAPANLYGESKLKGEAEALKYSENTVVRTSWLFTRHRGIPSWIRDRLMGEGVFRVVADQTACLTYVPHLADAVATLLDSGAPGLHHCVNPGPRTPLELAEELRIRLGGTGRFEAVRWEDLGLPAPRPSYSALRTRRSVCLPPLEEALKEWMSHG